MPRSGVAGLSSRERSADEIIFIRHAAAPRMRSSRLAQIGVGIDLGGRLGAGQADVARAHEDVGIADIDERHIDGADAGDIETIDRVARRQQRAGRSAGGIGQIHEDLRARARGRRAPRSRRAPGAGRPSPAPPA